MHRCLELARMGSGGVAPNPMVGAVLVHNGQILGEGYHQQFGQAHAEVNCIASVRDEYRELIAKATLFVSLEPCAHFGKTPPCTDLIISNRIPKVVIGCRDPFPEVNGKGIEKLKAAGVEIELGVLENECRELNRRFFTFHLRHRPYIILKWAQTHDRRIAGAAAVEGASRLFISNAYTNRIVHKWRSEEMSVLVGTRTALLDDPQLTTRLWPGHHPLRLVVDKELSLPRSLQLFDEKNPTIVFNLRQHSLPLEKALSGLEISGTTYYQVTADVSLVHQMLHALYQMNIQSVLVEGGAYLLQSFIDEGVWDEARVITNETLVLSEEGLTGLPAPVLDNYKLESSEEIFSDVVRTYRNRHNK